MGIRENKKFFAWCKKVSICVVNYNYDYTPAIKRKRTSLRKKARYIKETYNYSFVERCENT